MASPKTCSNTSCSCVSRLHDDDDVERAGQGARDARDGGGDDAVQRAQARAARATTAPAGRTSPTRPRGACATSCVAPRRRHARDRPRDRVRIDVAQVNLREARRQRVQVDVVGVAGAEQAQAPASRARARARRSRASGARGARRTRLVADGARVRRDLLGDGGGELARLDHGSRRLTGVAAPCRAPRGRRRHARGCPAAVAGTEGRAVGEALLSASTAAGPTQACVAPGKQRLGRSRAWARRPPAPLDAGSAGFG